MSNEPDLKLRQELIKKFESNNFSQLFKDITKLQKIFPNSLFLLSLLGNINNKKKNYNQAINNFENVIKINPNFEDAHYNLGVIYKTINIIDKSMISFEKCLKLNPKKYEAYNNLGNIYRDKQKTDFAIRHYLVSLDINPNYLIALQNLGVCLQNYEFSSFSDVTEKHIVNLLDKNKILRPVDIVKTLIKFIFLNNNYNETITNYKKIESETSLDELIDRLLKIKILNKLFEITPITDLKIEKVIKYIRSKILFSIKSITNLNNASKFMKLIASQCYINEYIYAKKNEEILALHELEKIIAKKLTKNNSDNFILEITCLAAYKSLHSYKWSSKLISTNKLSDLVNQQISNPKKELEIRNEIKTYKIKDKISLKVKDQYENSPYPRWEKIALKNTPEKPIDFFNKLNLYTNNEKINKWDEIEVLVAGCGTGQHAITTATKYKDASITALDLSASSLSYAKRKADELEIKNINFIQMDLLDLSKFKKKFNIIESVGVLHHMDKPYEGWKTLCDNLVTGGMIMVGLYSKIARNHIIKIKEDIKNLNIKINRENIINFRDKIIKSNNKDYALVKESSDFYSYSNFIDLIFHVQENRFTIPEINNCINKLNLQFCGFENRLLLNSFKKIYKNKKDLYNLELWNNFETNNTRIFAGMYQFWCQKN